MPRIGRVELAISQRGFPVEEIPKVQRYVTSDSHQAAGTEQQRDAHYPNGAGMEQLAEGLQD